jgi:hypothetical protein
MKVHRNKAVGIVIIVISSVDACLFLSLIYANIKPGLPLGILGLLGIGLGSMYLRGTYFEATADSLILQAVIGPAKKTYRLKSKEDISIDGRNVYLTDEGERRRLPVYAWMADKQDWEAFNRWLKSKR